MPHVDINNHSCYYEIQGDESAHPVVFVHGTFMNLRMWDPQVQALSEKYRTITYDMRGYGKSSCPSAFEKYDWVEDLRQLLDHLEIKKTFICGTTMGGAIALQFALDFPERTLGVILAASGPGPADPPLPLPDTFFKMRKALIEIVETRGMSAAIMAQGYLKILNHVSMKGTDESIPRKVYDILLQNDSKEYANMLRASTDFDPSDKKMSTRERIIRLSELKSPAMIAIGTEDIQFREQAKHMSDAIENPTLIEFPGQGTLLTLSAPADFSNSLDAFIVSAISGKLIKQNEPKENAILELE